MINCGIVAEYNPFHNGHLYHITKTREVYKDANIICVMSGNFTQRGEVAIVDKWKRAEIAINCGADLVLELPEVYSTQSANRFCYGAVNILKGIGITDYISFGCETDDIDSLNKIIETKSTNEYQSLLKEELDKGNTFAKAVSNALSILGCDGDITALPNNILAFEYLSAIKDSNIKPLPIKRTSNSHNDLQLYENITSATSIRKALNENQDISKVVPPFAFDILTNATYNSLEKYFDIIRYKIISLGPEKLTAYHDVTEGIENKIYESALISTNLNDFIMNIKSKRYLYTRIQRIMIYILLDIKKDFIKVLDDQNLPVYARILAFNPKKKEILSELKKQAQIPIISKTADYKKLLDPTLQQIFETTVRATNIYSIHSDIKANSDFTMQIKKQI